MQEIKQSTATLALVFYMVDDTDHVTPETGLSPTVTISKNGGSFASPSGTVSEIGGGFYKVAGNATDSNTLGTLALKATATGADPVAMAYSVVANIESDTYTRLGEPTGASVAADIDQIDGMVDSLNDYDGTDTSGVTTLLSRLSTLRAGYLDKLNVSGTLAHSDAAATYKADVSGLATSADLTTVDGVVDAIKAKTDNLPADPAGISDLPDDPLDSNETQAAVGVVLAAYDPPTRAEATADKDEILAVSPPNVEAIADAVWDEALAGHTDTGSAGAGMSAASASGDPWETVVPGSYDDGTAGAALGRLNNTPAASPIVVVPAPSTDDDLCVVYLNTETISGVVTEDIDIEFHLIGNLPQKTISGKIVQGSIATASTDSDGQATVELEKGLTYEAKSYELFGTKHLRFTVPDADTYDPATTLPDTEA